MDLPQNYCSIGILSEVGLRKKLANELSIWYILWELTKKCQGGNIFPLNDVILLAKKVFFYRGKPVSDKTVKRIIKKGQTNNLWKIIGPDNSRILLSGIGTVGSHHLHPIKKTKSKFITTAQYRKTKELVGSNLTRTASLTLHSAERSTDHKRSQLLIGKQIGSSRVTVCKRLKNRAKIIKNWMIVNQSKPVKINTVEYYKELQRLKDIKNHWNYTQFPRTCELTNTEETKGTIKLLLTTRTVNTYLPTAKTQWKHKNWNRRIRNRTWKRASPTQKCTLVSPNVLVKKRIKRITAKEPDPFNEKSNIEFSNKLNTFYRIDETNVYSSWFDNMHRVYF